MKRIRVSQHFYLDEFVDPVTYFEPEMGLDKLDFRLFTIAEILRVKKGSSLTINNWFNYYNGEKPEEFMKWVDTQSHIHQWSGLRTENCKIGAKLSAHKEGKAIDPKGNSKELFNIVRKNVKLFYDIGLRRLEDPKITKGWLHLDTSERNFQEGKIRVVGRYKHAFDLVVK